MPSSTDGDCTDGAILERSARRPIDVDGCPSGAVRLTRSRRVTIRAETRDHGFLKADPIGTRWRNHGRE
jgi:hypothetical protein